jgi:hypothetical protein
VVIAGTGIAATLSNLFAGLQIIFGQFNRGDFEKRLPEKMVL